MKKKYVILGYMGSGKSSVAQLLAEKLQIAWIDLDAYITSKIGMTITEIFTQKGEIYFRKIEAAYLQDILQQPQHCVLSLGGGTPCYAGNMDTLTQTEAVTTFYLSASIETLTHRLFLEKDQRPLIAHLQTEGELNDYIRKHLFERRFYYNQADVVVNTNQKSIEEIAFEIEQHLG
mgnify:CR=1 FL=1